MIMIMFVSSNVLAHLNQLFSHPNLFVSSKKALKKQRTLIMDESNDINSPY